MPLFRAGRTARVTNEGISIALVTPGEAPRFKALTRALERPLPPPFPVELALMPQVRKPEASLLTATHTHLSNA